jgi:hypothetical protein
MHQSTGNRYSFEKYLIVQKMNIELTFLKTRPAGVSFGPVTDN